MTRREPIHPELPFTEAELAAAWIIVGVAAEEAIRLAAAAAVELPKSLDEADAGDAEDGESSIRPSRVHFTGSFSSALHLAADVCSGGTLLSETAREAWLERWDLRVDSDEAERRVAQLDRLGPEWSACRPVFYRLLTAGTL